MLLPIIRVIKQSVHYPERLALHPETRPEKCIKAVQQCTKLSAAPSHVGEFSHLDVAVCPVIDEN
jgi:hypothetical protein